MFVVCESIFRKVFNERLLLYSLPSTQRTHYHKQVHLFNLFSNRIESLYSIENLVYSYNDHIFYDLKCQSTYHTYVLLHFNHFKQTERPAQSSCFFVQLPKLTKEIEKENEMRFEHLTLNYLFVSRSFSYPLKFIIFKSCRRRVYSIRFWTVIKSTFSLKIMKVHIWHM